MIKKTTAFICLIFALFSCTKSNNIEPLSKEALKAETPIVKKLLNTNDRSVVSMTFQNHLDPNERYSYVYNKIFRTSELLNLNESQKHLVKELLDVLSPDIYISGSKAREHVASVFLPKWAEKAKVAFSLNDIKVIFASFDTPQQAKNIIQPYSDVACGPNEVFSECGPTIEPTLEVQDPEPGSCKVGCFCKPGYIREYITGPCVSITNPPNPVSCDCKSKNSVITLCGGIYNTQTCKVTKCKIVRFCGIALAEECDGQCMNI